MKEKEAKSEILSFFHMGNLRMAFERKDMGNSAKGGLKYLKFFLHSGGNRKNSRMMKHKNCGVHSVRKHIPVRHTTAIENPF